MLGSSMSDDPELVIELGCMVDGLGQASKSVFSLATDPRMVYG